MSESLYAVGRGKPPLHTRFQKGQSGNPSGKPGPAKLARQRFERALLGALEGSPQDRDTQSGNWLTAIAQRMVLDAGAGKGSAQRLILSVLEAGCREEKEAEDFSLVQGKEQGNELFSAEELLGPDRSREELARMEIVLLKKVLERLDEADAQKARAAAERLSLVQGKTQGNKSGPAGEPMPQAGEAAPVEDASTADADSDVSQAADAEEQGSAQGFSLVQGKKQGNENFDGGDGPQAAARDAAPANSLSEGISQAIIFAKAPAAGLAAHG